MPTASLSPKTHRLEFLDACRGIAALCVVLYHFLQAKTPLLHLLFNDVQNLGAFGVYVFFFVSGFIIPISLQRYSLGQFWRSRFFRLVPTYWFSLALTLALGFTGLVLLDPVFFTGNRLVYTLNLLMLPMVAHKPAIVAVSWTLTIELIFYAFCSVLKAAGVLSHRLATAYTAIGLFVVWRVIGTFSFGPRHLKAEWAVLVVASFVGSVFYEVHAGKLSAKVLYPVLLLFLVSAFISIHFSAVSPAATVEPAGSFGTFALTWLLATGFFCMVFWLRARSFPSPLLWLGRISYSLYLMHGIAGLVVKHVIGDHSCTWLLQLTVALVAADLSYRFVERPTLRLAKGSHRGEAASPSAPILSA